MTNYYEETMPEIINKDEYLNYYIDESLPLINRLKTILQKGEPIQKQALISKLSIYKTTSLFNELIEYIINDIQTWDKETIFLFPQKIYTLINQNESSIIELFGQKLFNKIIKYYITIISSTDEEISNNYIFYFDKMIDYFNSKVITFPYKINDDIYDEIIALGKFGQSIRNRKLSIFLCCGFIRLLKDINNQNVKKLFDRICFLFCDNEKEVEMQLSKEIEYLLQIFKNDSLNNNEVLNSITCYINNDTNHIIQSTTIISLVKNFYLIDNDKLIMNVLDKIKEIFEAESNYEQKYKNDIFYEIILMIYYNYKKLNYKKSKALLFDNNIIINFIFDNKTEILILDNLDKIFFLFNEVYPYFEQENNINNKNNIIEGSKIKTNNINLEELINSIYNILFINNISNEEIKKNVLSENQKSFYNNIMKIIPLFSNTPKEKKLYDKITNLFNQEKIFPILNCYSNFFSASKNTKSKNILYNILLYFLKNISNIPPNSTLEFNTKQLSSIMNYDFTESYYSLYINENVYIKLFNFILNNILVTYKQSSNLFTNNIHLLLCDLFRRIIKKIFKYLNNSLFSNEYEQKESLNKIYLNHLKRKSIDKIYENIFNDYLKPIIENIQIGYHIKAEVVRIFPYIILYSKEYNFYQKYITEKIFNAQSFFFRRYSYPFMKKCFQIFSFKLIQDIGLLNIIFDLINDKNNIISTNIISLLYEFSGKIIFNSENSFEKISKSLSKIISSIKSKNFDIEKNNYIKKFLNLKNNNKSQEKESFIKNENHLREKENKILGKDLIDEKNKGSCIKNNGTGIPRKKDDFKLINKIHISHYMSNNKKETSSNKKEMSNSSTYFRINSSRPRLYKINNKSQFYDSKDNPKTKILLPKINSTLNTTQKQFRIKKPRRNTTFVNKIIDFSQIKNNQINKLKLGIKKIDKKIDSLIIPKFEPSKNKEVIYRNNKSKLTSSHSHMKLNSSKIHINYNYLFNIDKRNKNSKHRQGSVLKFSGIIYTQKFSSKN